MDPNTRLRIATRIHFALLRHLGDSVEVQDILHRPAETREVLWVCEASGDDELIALAAQWRQASRQEAAPASPPRRERPATTPPDSTWGRDNSGFGVSRPPELQAPKPAGASASGSPKPDRDWLKPRTWLRTR